VRHRQTGGDSHVRPMAAAPHSDSTRISRFGDENGKVSHITSPRDAMTRGSPAIAVGDILSRIALTGSCRQPERPRNLSEGCLLRLAHQHAANAEKSAFLGCLGDVLTDLA